MTKKIISLLFFSFVTLYFGAIPLFAQEGASNNKFGIHIAKPHDEDIEKAAELVNGNGGAWGYVTVVMQDDDRKKDQWQAHFDMMRRLKLIPIVRLATHPEGSNWKRPSVDEADDWANFLDSLNWPVKDRYVILFNEPNHASEWGGEVDTKSYAEVAKAFAEKLNAKNPDFVVMMAGMDAAAPSARPSLEDSGIFVRQVVEAIGKDTVNNLFEAYASHSYPNPAFSGPPTASGKGTVRSYEWELNLLNQLGIKELPVFITETGWNGDSVGRDKTAEYLKYAYQNIWLTDGRVKAVTPFILNYQGEPFLKFSWRKFESEDFYPQFEAIKNLTKIVGKPQIHERGRILFDLPTDMVEDSNYHYTITLKNEGQGYWDKGHGYKLKLTDAENNEYLFADLFRIEPGQAGVIDLYFKTDKPTNVQVRKIELYQYDKKILESNAWKYVVSPLPSLKLQAKFLPKIETTSSKFEVQIFNENEELVYKKKMIKVESGVGKIDNIRNIAYGRTYRIVILHEGYLPRQTYFKFERGTNEIVFERMLPFDLNGDGKLSLEDIWKGVTQPSELEKFLP